jgi:hypothetical protein
MATYGWSEDYVGDELDFVKGWMFFNWSLANEANKHGCGLEIVGKGYVQQEKQRLKDKQNGNARKNQR